MPWGENGFHRWPFIKLHGKELEKKIDPYNVSSSNFTSQRDDTKYPPLISGKDMTVEVVSCISGSHGFTSTEENRTTGDSRGGKLYPIDVAEVIRSSLIIHHPDAGFSSMETIYPTQKSDVSSGRWPRLQKKKDFKFKTESSSFNYSDVMPSGYFQIERQEEISRDAESCKTGTISCTGRLISNAS